MCTVNIIKVLSQTIIIWCSERSSSKAQVLSILFLLIQWLSDVNQKVMLENGEPVPVLLLANKVKKCFCLAVTCLHSVIHKVLISHNNTPLVL